MTRAGRIGGLIAVVIGTLLLAPILVSAQEDYGFMPKGGKALLLELLGTPPDAAALREVAMSRRSEAEWRELMAQRQPKLSERDLNELAEYLAVNLPVSEAAVEKAATRGDPGSALPPDGRELAWTQCQFCHSLFSSYLTQQRDVQGWRSIFLSPFHRGMKMTEKERETFARYSATSMPMKINDVPADLRF